mmetsp:Transcript_27726/g.76350  ORF Transcript_27726/g.76350 Transcript_27726/m.76350 type:complete len:287 (-) Transcript_27726:81-941(-)
MDRVLPGRASERGGAETRRSPGSFHWRGQGCGAGQGELLPTLLDSGTSADRACPAVLADERCGPDAVPWGAFAHYCARLVWHGLREVAHFDRGDGGWLVGHRDGGLLLPADGGGPWPGAPGAVACARDAEAARLPRLLHAHTAGGARHRSRRRPCLGWCGGHQPRAVLKRWRRDVDRGGGWGKDWSLWLGRLALQLGRARRGHLRAHLPRRGRPRAHPGRHQRGAVQLHGHGLHPAAARVRQGHQSRRAHRRIHQSRRRGARREGQQSDAALALGCALPSAGQPVR